MIQQSQESLKRTLQDVLTLLQVLGFRINWENSALVPTQVIQYLGLKLDSTQMTIALPKDKLKGIVQSCAQASRGEYHGSQFSPTDREDDSHSNGSSSSTLMLQKPPETEE